MNNQTLASGYEAKSPILYTLRCSSFQEDSDVHLVVEFLSTKKSVHFQFYTGSYSPRKFLSAVYQLLGSTSQDAPFTTSS